VNGEDVPYKRLEVYPGLAALGGLPATAIPVGRTRHGLPIGIQAIGGRFEDATTLQFASLLEREQGCTFSPPPGYE
jgi:amidase